MRSDNHQLPCVVCTTSNFLVYNLQLPHMTSNFLMVATVMVVMVVVVTKTEQDRTGQDKTGRN